MQDGIYMYQHQVICEQWNVSYRVENIQNIPDHINNNSWLQRRENKKRKPMKPKVQQISDMSTFICKVHV